MYMKKSKPSNVMWRQSREKRGGSGSDLPKYLKKRLKKVLQPCKKLICQLEEQRKALAPFCE